MVTMAVGINEALVRVRSQVNVSVALFWKSTECFKCDPEPLVELSPAFRNASVIVSTFYRSATTVRVGLDQHEPSNCSIPSFENKGVYEIDILDEETCLVTTVTNATSIYLPFLGVLMIQFFFDFLRRLICAFIERRNLPTPDANGEENEHSSQSPLRSSSSTIHNPVLETVNRTRVRSLDAFRGLCLFLMIFVNYGGGKLWIFEHAPWNGMTVADLVFPWFVWIMGLSLAISMRSQRRKCSRKKIFLKVLSRSAELFALGLILNSIGNNDISKLRIPGVLQRFAISYIVVATIHMFFSRATDAAEMEKWAKVRDVVLYWQEWVVMIMLVAIHTLITFYLDVPNCPKGYLGPGGKQEGGKYFNCTGGSAGYIDRVLLGTNHMYAHPTTEEVYGTTQHYDPEGVLGCLTSIFLTFLGLQAGKVLLTFKRPRHRLSRWFAWGTFVGLLAGILCGFSKEDGYIPINKNLWSLSYVLCTASFAFLLLCAFYLLIDIFGVWDGVPFIHLGMNSILVYIGHLLVTGMLPWFWAGPETHWRYLAMNFGGVYLWVLTAYALHKNRLYLAL